METFPFFFFLTVAAYDLVQRKVALPLFDVTRVRFDL